MGLSFVGASLSSPGAMEAHEHNLPKDLPLRRIAANPSWIISMTTTSAPATQNVVR